MFVRVQKVRQAGRVYEYVHVVEGYRDGDGKVRHRVVANLGRRDRLKDSGALDNLAAAFTRLDPEPGIHLCGALPLVAPVLQRLDLVGIVDRACPMRGRAHLSHGEVIAALVSNSLTAPRPLYDVVDWAQTYATNDWIETPAGLLNDDRLGRALDAVSEHLDEVTGALALSAIASFGVDAARLHWDFTSVAFAGAYAGQDPVAARIGFGHSSDHRSHRRQLKVAHATTASGIPLYGRVVDGSRHEGAETNTLLEHLRGLASPAPAARRRLGAGHHGQPVCLRCHPRRRPHPLCLPAAQKLRLRGRRPCGPGVGIQGTQLLLAALGSSPQGAASHLRRV